MTWPFLRPSLRQSGVFDTVVGELFARAITVEQSKAGLDLGKPT